MSVEALIARIEQRMTVLRAGDPKFSERRVLIDAGLDLSTFRRIRSRGQAPGVGILARLETALGVAPGFFLEALTERGDHVASVATTIVHVRGAVQAGVWRPSVEWASAEWFPITVPEDRRFPARIRRFGLVVRGQSMNKIYPEGSVVTVVQYAEIGRDPRNGEKVVVQRRNPRTDEYETTLKEVEITKDGRTLLWPRSFEPEFQTPIVIGAGDVPISNEVGPDDDLMSGPRYVTDGLEVIISGLVISSNRLEDVSM